MSDRVTLRLRTALDARLDVQCLAPNRLALLGETEIAALPAWYGRSRACVGDFFDVQGGRAAVLQIEGATGLIDGLGSRMAGGELLVDGDAGGGLAREMSGGSVDVRGSAGDDAGVAMRGGVLRIHGNAGDRLGAAVPGAATGMRGGEIVVGGHAGAEAAAACRRGLVVVGGDVGPRAARGMIAGSLVVFGALGDGPGRFLKRGTIVALGGVDVPSTYRYACTYRPPHLRLTMTYLMRRYGLPVTGEMVAGRYRRYCGDLLPPAKGELLVWAAPADAVAN